jgi:hypothetical protein
MGDNDTRNVEQSSDKINFVTCASCWDFYIRILFVHLVEHATQIWKVSEIYELSSSATTVPYIPLQVGRMFPQAVYFPIRTLYLTLKIEQRERYKSAEQAAAIAGKLAASSQVRLQKLSVSRTYALET